MNQLAMIVGDVTATGGCAHDARPIEKQFVTILHGTSVVIVCYSACLLFANYLDDDGSRTWGPPKVQISKP